MYDSSIEMVQNVTMGNKIMGDDSKPRNVLSLAFVQIFFVLYIFFKFNSLNLLSSLSAWSRPGFYKVTS